MKKIELTYKTIKGGELKAGDLFVNSTKEEMDKIMNSEEGGVGVFIKTNQPLSQIEGRDADVRKITIVKK